MTTRSFTVLDVLVGDSVLPLYTSSAAPTNGTTGTLAGSAPKGALLIDTNAGALYQNTNTLASPTWTLSGAGGGGGLPMANTALNTVGAGTLLGAALAGRLITRGGAQGGTAFTDTTDTAANIIAAIPGAEVNQSFLVEYLNTTNAQATLAGGTGVTPTGLLAVGQNCRWTGLLTITGAATVSIYGLSIVDRGIDNFNATSDPGTGQDNTLGYGVGSIIFNTTAGQLRWWECRDASTGAAKWVFSGADYANGGTTPSTEVTVFGGGTATLPAEGNANRQISSAGINPGATGADNVLAVYSLPASSFDQALRGLQITAAGSFGATNNNKRVKIIFNPATAVVGSTVGAGGTTIADTGTVTTNGGGWEVAANVFKYGAGGSNTQIGIHSQAQVGAAVAALLAPSLITATESGAILIAITGNATTVASDIAFNWLEVNAMN